MKANLDIEFATAFEGCAENCRSFDVDVDKYYANGKVFSVVCTCKNIELCKHLAEYIKEIREVD